MAIASLPKMRQRFYVLLHRYQHNEYRLANNLNLDIRLRDVCKSERGALRWVLGIIADLHNSALHPSRYADRLSPPKKENEHDFNPHEKE